MPSNTAQQPQQSLLAHVRQLARTAQFYWFLSHVFAIVFMLLATTMSIFKGGLNPSVVRYYQLSITSIIVTYLIVIRQTYKSRPITFIFSQLFKLIGDDNVQYLILAVVLRVFSSRVYGPVNVTTLQPFTIFALFHSLTYFQTQLLPFFAFVAPVTKQRIASGIQTFVKKYNETFLFVASNMEFMTTVTYCIQVIGMVISARVFRSSYFLQNIKSIVLACSYVIFSKIRYDQTRYMRTLINSYDLKINQFVYNSRFVPPFIKNLVAQIRALIIYSVHRIHLPVAQQEAKRN